MGVYKILGLDFESQGLDVQTVNITEVGAHLVGVLPDGLPDNKDLWQTDKVLEAFLWEPGYPPQTKEIVELTGITDEMLKTTGQLPRLVIERQLFPLMLEADFIMAHNKKYDKELLYATAKRYGLTVPEKQWICTMSEMPYGPKQTCRKLAHVALDHGVPMDGRTLHRAGDDVRLMFELVAKYRLEEVLAYVREPSCVIRAVIPAPWNDGGQGKENAIRRGFSWESPRGSELKFEKQWVKQIKVSKYDAECAEAPFKITKVG